MWIDELEKKVNEDGQKAIAKKLSSSQSLISLWLRGERIPGTKKILPLSELLNMEPKKLLEEINENEKG
ncbi:hypothetical protein THF1D04_10769 [Vibrio owensii]|uniref:HTH cro/C1-type domain-containing protein n=1 Tax=Vibrio owensii TaxID=696485 RepID=A0AAU9PYZ1_9VIBR|nr:hypothetical protein THF1D04_10769 [Vibrio owensii]